eukprot:gb/GECG01004369.1/.p1 GENE.gb/GECG01004369.1/~~gb/GECG01004369.1/.p1  ORF type:complete len:602 (+),score=90.24 gb/GECG01004369.1/:1-1806(+)
MSECDQPDLSQFGVVIDTKGSYASVTPSTASAEAPQYYSREAIGPLDEYSEEDNEDEQDNQVDSVSSSSVAKATASGARYTPQPRHPKRERSAPGATFTFTGRYYDSGPIQEASSRKTRRATSELMQESANLTKNLFSSPSDSSEIAYRKRIEPPVSKELQEALGMGSQFQEPPFLPAMRRYGYPPGYIGIPSKKERDQEDWSNATTAAGYSYDAVARSTIRQRQGELISMWHSLIDALNFHLSNASNGWLSGILLDADVARHQTERQWFSREVAILQNNEVDRNASLLSSHVKEKASFLVRSPRAKGTASQYDDWRWAEGGCSSLDSDSTGSSACQILNSNEEESKEGQKACHEEEEEEGELNSSYETNERTEREASCEPLLEFFEEEEESPPSEESMSLGSSSENESNDKEDGSHPARRPRYWFLVRRPEICSEEFDVGTAGNSCYPSIVLRPYLPVCTCILPSNSSCTVKADGKYCLPGMMKSIPGLSGDPPTYHIWTTLPKPSPEPAPPGTEDPDEEHLRALRHQIIGAPVPSYRSAEHLASSQCVPVRSTPVFFPWPVPIDFTTICLVHGAKNDAYVISPPDKTRRSSKLVDVEEK